MSKPTLQLSESLTTEVALGRAGACRFASHPGRVLATILSRDRLQRLGPNRFHYHSRPVQVGPWQLKPELEFWAEWNGTDLRIRLLDSRLHGMPLEMELQPVTLDLEATIRPDSSGMVATATTSLSIRQVSVAGLLPLPLLTLVGRQALRACLARLESRCQSRLRLGALAWLTRGADAAD
jgi:hypothetical protein